MERLKEMCQFFVEKGEYCLKQARAKKELEGLNGQVTQQQEKTLLEQALSMPSGAGFKSVADWQQGCPNCFYAQRRSVISLNIVDNQKRCDDYTAT